MRLLTILTLCLCGGCSTWPFAASSSDIPAEAVRNYSRAHGISRDEARRELTMFRDAEHLRDLRQSQKEKMTNDQAPMTNH